MFNLPSVEQKAAARNRAYALMAANRAARRQQAKIQRLEEQVSEQEAILQEQHRLIKALAPGGLRGRAVRGRVQHGGEPQLKIVEASPTPRPQTEAERYERSKAGPTPFMDRLDEHLMINRAAVLDRLGV
jgi:hypothetical protein